MEKIEGSKIITIPAREYKSCSSCIHYEYTMVRSGFNPIYAHNCIHPIIKKDINYYNPYYGNLQDDITPVWCPIEKENNKDGSDKD